MGVKDDVFGIFDLIDSATYGSENAYVRNVYRTLPDMNKRVLNGLETPFVAALDDGTVISVLTVTRRAEPGNASIPMMVTADAHRKQGHAVAVLRFALSTLADLGFRKVFSTCPLDNPAALATLTRAGFEREGRMNDVYGPAGHAVICGRPI
jgi:ribosomal protein S18 acetylase RimI-like enzyme